MPPAKLSKPSIDGVFAVLKLGIRCQKTHEDEI